MQVSFSKSSYVVLEGLGAAGLAYVAAISLDGTQIIVAAFGTLTAISTLYFAYLTNKNTKALTATKEALIETKAVVSETAETAKILAKETSIVAVETAKKADDLVKQSEQIHVLVNSNLAAKNKELDEEKARNVTLQLLVDKLLTQAVDAKTKIPEEVKM